MADEKTLLTAKGITKQFPGTLALNHVDLEIRKGEVHVLLGENGAGKSTLVKILSGILRRDAGEIVFAGKPVDFKNVREAQQEGITIIHQELNLLPERSIAQNIFIGREPLRKRNICAVNYKKMVHDSVELLKSVGLEVDPHIQIKNISIAQQQMVEVARALSNRIKLLIMDEPTSSLTRREIDRLFTIIRNLKSKGVSIIYISHRMDEIQEIGDRVSVMRDGEMIDTVDVDHIDMDSVIYEMVGRKISNLYARRFNQPGKEVLRTENLTGLRFRNVNIVVHEGEIVSLSGLIGAGRTEIAKAIFGYDPIKRGKYYLFGEEMCHPTPKRCVKKGMAFLPEDRKEEGLVIRMPVWGNIISASLPTVYRHGIAKAKAAKETAQKYVSEMNIVTPDIYKKVSELSGGNQQKVVIGKWLAPGCRFFIFDEPTRGIDVGAKAEIYKLLDKLASEGAGILMISSEMSEVIGLSDRTYVMRDGEVAMELSKHDEITKEKIMLHVLGGGKEKHDATPA